jgi:hypothetical protein
LLWHVVRESEIVLARYRLEGKWRGFALWLLLAGCGRISVVTLDAVDRPVPEVGDDPRVDAPDAGREPVLDAGASLDAARATSDASGAADTSVADSAVVDSAVVDASVADASGADSSVADSAMAEDARQDAAGVDSGPASCGGTRALSLCWYLSPVDTSCDQVCSGKGGSDARAIALVGTAAQGGELAHCAQVLAALGYTGTVTPGTRDQFGVGCHLWDNDGWWIESMPAFSTAAKTSYARIACACMR